MGLLRSLENRHVIYRTKEDDVLYTLVPLNKSSYLNFIDLLAIITFQKKVIQKGLSYNFA